MSRPLQIIRNSTGKLIQCIQRIARGCLYAKRMLGPPTARSVGASQLLVAITALQFFRKHLPSSRMLGHELEDEVCNLVSLFVQCKVPSVEQVDLRIRKIPSEGFRTRSDEGGVVLAPGHEGRGLVVAEPGLPSGIGRDVDPIIVEQVSLDFALTGPRQISRLPDPGSRIVAIWMGRSSDVPLFGGLERKKSVEHFRMNVRIRPVFRDFGP